MVRDPWILPTLAGQTRSTGLPSFGPEYSKSSHFYLYTVRSQATVNGIGVAAVSLELVQFQPVQVTCFAIVEPIAREWPA